MKKRGLSMIVTSLIIILLVLVAVGVLYVVYMNFVRTGAGGISLGKFTIDLEIENAYIEGSDIKVSVKRNPGEGDLIAINFIISDGDDSEIFREDTTIQELGGESFSLTPVELNIDDVETVSIAPIYLSDSGNEIIGDIIDTYNIRRNGGGSGNGNGNGNGCTPDCTGLQCGLDPVCGQECGPCTGVDVCNATGQCVAPENCTDTCADYGYECGTWIICGNETDCLPGGCTEGICVEGQCYVATADLTGGIIDNVWPPSGIYFDSDEFPINISYINHWIRFTSGTEQGQCSLIYDYIFPPEEPTYNKSHIRLGETSTEIQTGDGFDIWDTFINCDTAGS